MKCIAINKKYLFSFIELSSEETKKIIISLLNEDLSNLNGNSKVLAQVIYNDNFIISNKRKKAIKKRWQND